MTLSSLLSEVRPPLPVAACRVPMRDSVDAAMDRYADGDDRAFDDVFRGLGRTLLAFLQRLCGQPDLAQDLLQETLLRMQRARGSFPRGRSAKLWAYAIARNLYLDHCAASRS